MDNGASSYRRFLDGDDGGMVEIVRDYKDGLMLYLNGYVQNIHTAQELAEDTFVRLAVKKPHFKGSSAFKTWLYAVARSIALDYLRRSKKALHIPLEDCAELADEYAELESAYLRGEQKLILHRAMNRLNPDYRQVLFLIYFEGFDNAQAADVMKKSKRQIENLVYRAKLSLKNELEKEDFTYENL